MPERYRLGRLVKRGGMAEIYEGTLRGPDGFERRIALKRLLPELSDDESLRAAFIDEARILSKLSSANIVSILDFGLMDDRPFQALEFVDGADLTVLKTILEARGERFTPAIALYITMEVAHALEHAHSALDDRNELLGVVHRDVSPSNVLVSWNGEVRLSDFGVALAEHRTARTQVGIAKGTLFYMPPEQARGSEVDSRTDLYALGLVLHWMLSGHSPLEDDDIRLSVQAGDRVPIDSSLPDDIAHIVERCTRFRAAERYENASSLAADTWRALHARISSDARQLMKAWVGNLRPDRPSAQHPIADLFDVELIKIPNQGTLPRYASLGAPTQVVIKDVPIARAVSLGSSIPHISLAEPDEEAPTSLSPSQAHVKSHHPLSSKSPEKGINAKTNGALDPSPDITARAARPAVRPSESANRESRSHLQVLPKSSPAIPAASSSDALIGTVINGYRLIEQVGQGGWSRVYRAGHELLRLEAAVKVAREELSEVGVKRFRREAQILCKLQHPNIVRVVDCGTTSQNLPFLTMELLQGRSLKDILEVEAPLDPARAAYLTKQVAAGLSAAHQSGLVHRDLKPGNIMVVSVEGDEEAKILDFGIARAFEGQALRTRLTDGGNFLGTPAYVSPEQIRSPSTVSPSTDLYSLGVVLYRMLSGRLPFEGSAAEMVTAHLRTPPPPLPEHGALGRLALQLLEKSPAKRPASADEVVALVEAIEAEPAAPSGARPRAYTPAQPVVAKPAIRPDSVTPVLLKTDGAPGRSRWVLPVVLFTFTALVVASLVAMLLLWETNEPAELSLPSLEGSSE